MIYLREKIDKIGRGRSNRLLVFTLDIKLNLTADQLDQLVERRTTEREVSGSSPRLDQHSGS